MNTSPERAPVHPATLRFLSVVLATRLVRHSPPLRRLARPRQSVQIRQIFAELLPSIGVDVASGLHLRGEIVEIAEDDPDGVIEA